jgi:hypothetical protein
LKFPVVALPSVLLEVGVFIQEFLVGLGGLAGCSGPAWLALRRGPGRRGLVGFHVLFGFQW